MSRGVVASIDRAALAHNFSLIKRLAPHSQVIAMIKANAYGHGIVTVAKSLDKADAFGVACFDEAIRLRQHGVTKPIVLMQGFLTQEELGLCQQHALIPVIHDQVQLDIIEAANLTQPMSCWLECDSGMHRTGFLPASFLPALDLLKSKLPETSEITLMTHLACADHLDSTSAHSQIALFDGLVKEIDLPKSICNSAATLKFSSAHANWVRPGIMLYGISPLAQRSAKDLGLKPVMTLKAKLIAIKSLKAGDAIGYGSSYTCKENTRIGIVNIGYGDGYPWSAASGTPVLVQARACPLLGRVSMDMLAINLNSVPLATVGQSVTLWGEGLPVETVAAHCATIAYELVTKISSRVQLK